MTSPTHTVTITIAVSNVDFAPGTPAPSQILVRLSDATTGNDIGNPIIATGSPLIAVFPDIPDGSYIMTASTVDANGSPIPSNDVSGNPIASSVSAPSSR